MQVDIIEIKQKLSNSGGFLFAFFHSFSYLHHPIRRRKKMGKENFKNALVYLKTFLKWTFCAGITGIVCGSIGTLFHFCVEFATETRKANNWLLFLLPVSGLIIVFLYRACKIKKDEGTNMILSSIRSDEKPPLRMAPLIFISTVLTHLCGGSSGREGAALQIGGSIGAALGKFVHLDEKDRRIIIMCGMSAVFSALFGTPLTATIFSMEVISVGVIYYVAFIPCIISALIAYSIARFFGIPPTAFTISSIPNISLVACLQVAVLAAFCAGISILFCVSVHQSTHLYKKYLKNQYLRIAVGGTLIVLLSLIAGSDLYNGAGMEIVADAVAGSTRPEAFLLKIIFTALTLGAGFKGGEIVPAFYIGATFGCFAGGLLGLSPGFGAGIGLIAVFCGVVNCPFASLILSIELFGNQNIMIFALACAVSYMLSGRYSLYSSQKIVYSKLEPTFINANTK